LVKEGASIGANATIVGPRVIGQYAVVGAGAVVAKDVKDFGLVYGNPGRLEGWVCRCGGRLGREEGEKLRGLEGKKGRGLEGEKSWEIIRLECAGCGRVYLKDGEKVRRAEG